MKKIISIITGVFILLCCIGCKQEPINKSEANDIVRRYVKKEYRHKKNAKCYAFYYENAESMRVIVNLTSGYLEIDKAFVYFIEDYSNPDNRKYPVIVVQKNGKYKVYHEMVLSSPPPDMCVYNPWRILFYYQDGEFLDGEEPAV